MINEMMSTITVRHEKHTFSVRYQLYIVAYRNKVKNDNYKIKS